MKKMCRFLMSIGIPSLLLLGAYGYASPAQAQEDDELLDIVFVATPSVVGKNNFVQLEWESPDADYCIASDGWSGKKSPQGSEAVKPKKVKKYTYSIECFDNEGGTSDEVSVKVTVLKKRPARGPAPKEISFRTTKTKIAPGDTVSIIWKSKGAAACRAFGSDDWSGLKLPSGREILSPQGTTQYSLHCWAPNGSISDLKTVAVSVEEPPVEIKSGYQSFFNGFPSGQPILGGYQQNQPGPPAPPSGSNGPTLGNTLPSYAGVTCSNDIPRAVQPGCIEPLPPQVIIVSPQLYPSSAPARVSSFRVSSKYYDQTGDPILLTWRAVHATSCAASGDWDGTRPLEGSEHVKPTKDSEYRLTCSNPESNTQDTLSVAVTKRPPPRVTGTISMTLSPVKTTIAPGGSVHIAWEVYNATTCIASGAWAGAKPGIGSQIVTPQSSTTYYLDCNNDNVSKRKSVYVEVKSPYEDKSGYKPFDAPPHAALFPQISSAYPSQWVEAGAKDVLIGAFTVANSVSYDVYFHTPYFSDGDGTEGLGKALSNLRLYAEAPLGQGKTVGSSVASLPTQSRERVSMGRYNWQRIGGKSSVAFFVYADIKPDAVLTGNNDRLQIAQWSEDHALYGKGITVGQNITLQEYTLRPLLGPLPCLPSLQQGVGPCTDVVPPQPPASSATSTQVQQPPLPPSETPVATTATSTPVADMPNPVSQPPASSATSTPVTSGTSTSPTSGTSTPAT
ncbi:hypothetical protein HY621_01275 [Candidatus Uhrbacteria bacterium]|nr:hypothetical protein [Candidatus Uhrbacteria bacterium]